MVKYWLMKFEEVGLVGEGTKELPYQALLGTDLNDFIFTMARKIMMHDIYFIWHDGIYRMSAKLPKITGPSESTAMMTSFIFMLTLCGDFEQEGGE